MAGIALLGAGIFAHKAHLPAVIATPSLILKAVYSRSQASASSLSSALAELNPSAPAIDIYFDDGPQSLEELLAREDIVAVIICLPIARQPDVVYQALRAGKHVLSEKPIAPDVASARVLLDRYAGLEGTKPLWGVAENFRFIESLGYAAEQIAAIGGRIVTFNLRMFAYVGEDNKYYNTDWRKTPEHQGGFLLDGGVHFIAGLRMLLGGAGQEIHRVAGFTSLCTEKLVPADTLHAVATTGDGRSGTITICFAAEFKSGAELASAVEMEVVTTNGSVSWTHDYVRSVTRSDDGGMEVRNKEFGYNTGVVNEVKAFAKSVTETGAIDSRMVPIEGLKDLEIVQALLESGQNKAAVQTIGT